MSGVPGIAFDALFSIAQEVEIKGKTALITGSSSGIGKATACALAAAGVNLILIARREAQLLEIKSEVEKRSLGVQVDVLPGDVCKDKLYEDLKASGLLEKVWASPSAARLAIAHGVAYTIGHDRRPHLTVSHCEQVDILVANAGLARGKSAIGEALLSDWSEMMGAPCSPARCAAAW